MNVLIAVGALVIFIYGMLGTIVPSLGPRLGMDTLELSWLVLARGLAWPSPRSGRGALMDRYGRKPKILSGLVASMAGLALLAYATGLRGHSGHDLAGRGRQPCDHGRQCVGQ